MNFLELAKNRYSERLFDPRPVEHEKLDKIPEAGRIVPTACNYQPQRFYVMVRYDLQIAPDLCLMQEGNWPFAGIGKNKLKCTGLIFIFCR